MANRSEQAEKTQVNHQELIIEQFTKQAVPFSEMRGRSQEESLRLILAATKVTGDDNVLDVACGPGLVAFAFAEVARQVVAIDVTPAMIERARALQAQRSLSNITWHVGDVTQLPFKDAEFSVVCCRYAFHHFQDPRLVATEMVRVCAPGGRIAMADVFTSPDTVDAYNELEKLRDPSHVRALDLRELVGLAVGRGLANIQTQFYWMEVELETLMRASFPAAGDDKRVRELLTNDVGKQTFGVRVQQFNDEIRIAYPIAVVAGERRTAQ